MVQGRLARQRETAPRARDRAGVLVIVALLLACACLAAGCGETGSSQGASGTEESSPTPSVPTRTASLGEPVDEPPVRLVVVSAGPARLDPQAPAPAPGNRFVQVRATLTNTSGAELAINATPYSVYNTELLVDGVSHPGSLVVGSVRAIRTGVIPPATPLDLRYVFEVPEAASEGTFLWPPSSSATDRPVISVDVSGL